MLIFLMILKKSKEENIEEDFMERETGFEPATPTLARSCSTPELLPHVIRHDSKLPGTSGRTRTGTPEGGRF